MLGLLRRKNSLRRKAVIAFCSFKSISSCNCVAPAAAAAGVQRGETGKRRVLSPWMISRRNAHTGLYVHHTNPGSGRESVAIALGIIHALDRLQPGLGYFRPIDKTTIGGHRTAMMKHIYGFKDDVESMHGVTQSRAFELITQDKTDDLMEEVFKAFEEIRTRHDFLVIEGTNLKGWGGDVVTLNARIASMLGTSAMFVTDARGAVQSESNGCTSVEWEREILESTKVSKIAFRRENVDVLSAVIHAMPDAIRNVESLEKLFREIDLPLAGVIPEDKLLHSLQVQDVGRTLGAELLYGVQDVDVSMSTEVTTFIAATLQLSELLAYLPRHSSPSEGAVVIADATRSDILLSLLNLHQSRTSSNVAALVLTGGMRPTKHIELLVKDLATQGSLPVLLSPMSSFETSAILAKAEATIHPNSLRKIERAQLIFEEYVNLDVLTKALLKEQPVRMTPKLFIHTLYTRAKVNKQHIVLPEGEEPRTIQAAGAALRRDLCEITLLGRKEVIETVAKQFRVDIRQAQIVDPSASRKLEVYRDYFYETRKHKGVTREEAFDSLVGDFNYFGTCMVACGDADGMVSGAIHTTANTVRPALQIIKTSPHLPLVSSVFFMCLPDKVLVYGDCAINADPSCEDLAAIAIQSADTAAAFGLEPRVAMLSYATGNSNHGPLIQKVIDATSIAKKKRPDLLIEGPLQYDAAVNMETAMTKLKQKGNPVAGKANVLIFPDLNTGNNTYKAVQQSTGAIAVGPLLQGLLKPVNDLSRGCTVTDIVTTIALTAVQAIAMKSSQPEAIKT